MNLASLFLAIGLAAMAWFVTTTILIYEALRRRNINVNFIFLRFLSLKYASQYKEITFKETGRTGPLFYHWIVSINIALICAILVLILGLE